MWKLSEAPNRKWGNVCTKKGTIPTKRRDSLTSAIPFRLKGLYSTHLHEVAHMFCPVPGFHMWVMFVAKKPKCQNQQHENINGYASTEFALINHWKQQIFFNAWFGRNNRSQIDQEDIPSYEIKLKLKIYLLSQPPTFFFLCSLHRLEDTSELRWDGKIVRWIARHTPLLRACHPITE